ncbi:MAG: PAS domain S-box protein [Janthinobacterium lividum]
MSADTSAPTPCEAALAIEVEQLRRQLAATEQQMRVGNVRYRMILDSAVDYAVIALDLDGLVTEWNQGACRILGWTEAEMLGRPASVIFTLEDRRAGVPQAEMHAALEQGRGTDERWHLRKDNSCFWADGEMMPLKDESGAVQGFTKILRDRTEQRHAAERSRADAEFLRGVLASSGDCIKVLDLEGRLTFMSEGGQRVMEVSDFSAIRGCSWPDFWQGPGNADAIAALEAARAGGVGHFQGSADTMAGTTRFWDVQVTPIFGSDGRPERLLSVSRDMTAVRREELRRAALLELGDRLRDEMELAAMSIIGAEIIGRTLEVQRAGYGTLEGDGETLVVEEDWTASDCRSLAGHHRMSDYGLYAADLRRGETVSISDVREDPRTAATAERLESVSARALINLPLVEQDRTVAIVYINSDRPRTWTNDDIVFIRDVAERLRQAVERRRAESDLRELAASLERQVEERTAERNRVWEASLDLLLIVDFEGVFRKVNTAWTSLLGYAPDELIGHDVLEFIVPDDTDMTTDALKVATAGDLRVENRYRHKDGSFRWISWSATPASGVIYAVGRDVTAERERQAELAKTQDALRQSQKMEAVGQLTGGLAHDFNNLLTGVTGSLELLQTRIAQGRIKDVDRYVNAAQGAAKRAAALTHRLLAFSRQQTLDPKPTNVNRLVAGMEELIRRTVGPEITVEPLVAAGGLWSTLVDAGQLENALLNLCINARDAMPNGGKITIETGHKWLDDRSARERELPAGQYVTLCVSDTGTGMPPQVIARAFDPFFTTKPIGQGTGLGLSMIYGFARQSGGQVRIYSELGQGTMVCLYLPRHLGAEEAVELPPDLADAPRAVQGETVLVVDDEPTIRMLVTEVLEDLGYTAIEAADGVAGVKVLQSDVRIDLLVTDVGLPGGMNGRQVADAGRAVRPELKVLFITGYAENAVLSHSHLDPGMHVLTKPFAMEALASRIKDLISD